MTSTMDSTTIMSKISTNTIHSTESFTSASIVNDVTTSPLLSGSAKI
jgi:hypothetical protein